MTNSNAATTATTTRTTTPAYDANGVRVAPYSWDEQFMLDARAAGMTWAEAYRAREAARKQRPHWRWKTLNEILDEAEADTGA